MVSLGKFLEKTGLSSLGKIGKKKADDFLASKTNTAEIDAIEAEAIALTAEEVAFVSVEPNSVQAFLDKSFGKPGRYVPNREPKIFEHQDQNYMAIWADDTELSKQQLLVFLYTDAGRKMVASVGYTPELTDYDIDLSPTPFSVLVNGQKLKIGKGETTGTDDVNLVLS
jgi:hypothetical protein